MTSIEYATFSVTNIWLSVAQPTFYILISFLRLFLLIPLFISSFFFSVFYFIKSLSSSRSSVTLSAASPLALRTRSFRSAFQWPIRRPFLIVSIRDARAPENSDNGIQEVSRYVSMYPDIRSGHITRNFQNSATRCATSGRSHIPLHLLFPFCPPS